MTQDITVQANLFFAVFAQKVGKTALNRARLNAQSWDRKCATQNFRKIWYSEQIVRAIWQASSSGTQIN